MADTKIVVRTDVLAPEQDFKANYKCYHPSRLIGVMLEYLKMIWRVPSSAAYFDKIKWDRTGEVAEFYGDWRVLDKKDRFSKVTNRIVIQGKQGKDKMGEVTIKIKPTVITELPYATIIDKALLWTYLNLVYKRQILQYVDIAQRRVKEFDAEVRKLLEIPPLEHPHK